MNAICLNHSIYQALLLTDWPLLTMVLLCPWWSWLVKSSYIVSLSPPHRGHCVLSILYQPIVWIFGMVRHLSHILSIILWSSMFLKSCFHWLTCAESQLIASSMNSCLLDRQPTRCLLLLVMEYHYIFSSLLHKNCCKCLPKSLSVPLGNSF